MSYTPKLAGKPIPHIQDGPHDPVDSSGEDVDSGERLPPLFLMGFPTAFLGQRIHLKSTGRLPVEPTKRQAVVVLPASLRASLVGSIIAERVKV